MIDINNITIQIDAKVLLENASAHISDGQKVGLIGDNGCGKTTLFKVLKKEVEPVQGSVNFPHNNHISSVEQNIRETEISLMEFVLSKDVQLMYLRQQLQTASEWELPHIHDQLKLVGSESAEGRVARILSGLGFSNDDLNRPISSFSGGWRMRMALAAALFQPSDILLLDEPTNHLDLETSLWLENHLKKYTGTLLLISHDRTILNNICDYIIHFENKKLVTYSGNYDTFQKTKAIKQQVLTRQAAKLNAKRAHLQSFVDRFRYKATKAKQAQSRLKMLSKMEQTPEIFLDNEESFSFPVAQQLQPPLITIENGTTGYGDKIILRKLSLSIAENERIALLGKNGNGKSTFAKLIDGKIPLLEGKMHRSNKLEIGYFAQHQEEELPLEQTALQFLQTLMPDKTQTQIRAHLAQFGLEQEKAVTSISLLSGGEKARLLFARMTLSKPGLLILDEPTNHLDIKGREALVEALNEYNGSVILITHDFHLIESVAEELWLVQDGRCLPFKGDLEDYKKILLEKDSKVLPKKGDKKREAEKSVLSKKSSSEQRKIRAQILQLEKKLMLLSAEKEKYHALFQSPLTPKQILDIQKELNAIDVTINETEEKWLYLSEEIENDK